MIISNITPPQVWAASSRSLTNIGSGALASTSSVNQTLAAATAVQLTPSAGTLGMITVGVKTGPASTSTSQIALNDGTNNFIAATTPGGAGTFAVFAMVNTNAVGARLLNNDATVAATYATAAYVFTI